MNKLFFVIIIFLISSKAVVAQTISDSEEEWEISSTTHLWMRGQRSELRETPLVADSSLMASAQKSGGFLVQESLRLQKNRHQWLLRPSIDITESLYTLYPLEGEKIRSKTTAHWNELYWQFTGHDFWMVAIGLQNYQWGPAELMSPSNPLFHLFTNSQDPTFQMPGRNIVRLNLTPDANWSVISMFEVMKNEENEFLAEQKFAPKKLLKVERRLENPADYWGLTAGVEQKGDAFIGAYANNTLAETWSAYVDVKQTAISERFHPIARAPLLADMSLQDEAGKPYALGLFGVRLETEDFDCRYEWLFNELGFNDQDMTLAGLSILPQNPNFRQNQSRFFNSGRELPSRNYDYLSLRFNRFFSFKNLGFALRTLRSKRDDSSMMTAQWDGTWRDNWTFYFSAQFSPKNNSGEMNMLYKNKLNSGIKYTW